ncbi:DnaJ-domain-containing protein, partial [Thelephora ganbajun]
VPPTPEEVKEQGNEAFKSKNYTKAIDLYTRAIGERRNEPSYLTNRAAAYMTLKRFKPALTDCQQAASLQTDSPSTKTLIRLARCQTALGSSAAALSTIRAVLDLEPTNSVALQLQTKISQLEDHQANYLAAMKKKEWTLARLALDQCLQGIEGEGGEIPIEWRIWRIELELARGNWDGANASANDALRLAPNSPDVVTSRGLVLFLSGKLPQALHHVQSALRLDPGHEAAMQLRKRIKEVERLKEEGNKSFKSGVLNDAIEKYTAAIERIGNKDEEAKGGQIRATLLSNRATTLVKLSKYDEALTDIEESIALYPRNFKALRTRARIHLHLENFEGSVADFKAALEQAKLEDSIAEVRSLQAELKKAEAALKRSKTKDYYKILGVARDCTEAEIKKAYRKESLIHHPDKGGDEEKFKLVAEAFTVLSDPQRRQRYDMGEEDSEYGGGSGGMGGMDPQDIADLFAQFGGGMPRGFGGGGFSGGFHGFHSHGDSRGGYPF